MLACSRKLKDRDWGWGFKSQRQESEHCMPGLPVREPPTLVCTESYFFPKLCILPIGSNSGRKLQQWGGVGTRVCQTVKKWKCQRPCLLRICFVFFVPQLCTSPSPWVPRSPVTPQLLTSWVNSHSQHQSERGLRSRALHKSDKQAIDLFPAQSGWQGEVEQGVRGRRARA